MHPAKTLWIMDLSLQSTISSMTVAASMGVKKVISSSGSSAVDDPGWISTWKHYKTSRSEHQPGTVQNRLNIGSPQDSSGHSESWGGTATSRARPVCFFWLRLRRALMWSGRVGSKSEWIPVQYVTRASRVAIWNGFGADQTGNVTHMCLAKQERLTHVVI